MRSRLTWSVSKGFAPVLISSYTGVFQSVSFVYSGELDFFSLDSVVP